MGPVDLAHLTRYPFHPDAATYLKEQGLSAEELLKDRAFQRARTLGQQRVLKGLAEGVVDAPNTGSPVECQLELLGYVISRMIVATIGDRYLTNRMAIAESKRTSELLEGEEPRLLVTLAHTQGLGLTLNGGRLGVPVAQFLHGTRNMRDRNWKLVNMPLADGEVGLDRMKAIRLLEAVVQERYQDHLPSRPPDWVEEALSEALVQVRIHLAAARAHFQPLEMGEVDSASFPPCIKGIFGMMQAHENVSHMGRFALVSFLNNVGMDKDQIFEFFRMVPDFNVEKSRYQIEHIIGDISGTAYTAPECSTMKTHGICINPDELCGRPWMTHPLKYYRAKLRQQAKGGPAADGAAETATPTASDSPSGHPPTKGQENEG